MNVILKQSLDNLGTIGDVVRVSAGYARNFLLPRGLAIVAGAKQVKELEHHKRSLGVKLEKIKEEKREYAKKLEGLTITIRRKVGENEKLFGSVTNQDIAEALKEKGFAVDRRAIHVNQPIKKLGAYKVPCQLMEDVNAELNVAVVTEV